MAIDPTSERMISLAEAAKLMPHQPSIHTINNYLSTGIVNRSTGKMCFLERYRCGGSVMTSEEAVWRFLAELNKEE